MNAGVGIQPVQCCQDACLVTVGSQYHRLKLYTYAAARTLDGTGVTSGGGIVPHAEDSQRWGDPILGG